MGYLVWEWDGKYIKGNLVAKNVSRKAAFNLVESFNQFGKIQETSDGWVVLDTRNLPIGLIEKAST